MTRPPNVSAFGYLAGAAEEREVIHAELLKHFERDQTGESYATWNLEDVIDWLEARMEGT